MDLLIWNEFELKKPPLTTLPVVKIDFNILDLRRILDNSLAFYERQAEFEETAALCSRLLAKRKNSFKMMAGYKAFCKLNTALCRLLKLDIKTILGNFLGLIPEFQSTSKIDTYLPSRAHLEYVLVRLIGLQKIYVRIVSCCEDVARYFAKLLSKHFFMDIIALILATVSTIWKLSIKLGNHTAKLYKLLLSFHQHFPESIKPWLSSDFNFPEKLEEMRTLDAPQNSPKMVEGKKRPKIELMNTVNVAPPKPMLKIIGNLEKKVNSQLDLDVGVEISRDSMEPTFDLYKCNNVQAISDFFRAEDKLRQSGLKKCVTKNISDKDWIYFKKRVNYQIKSNNSKKAVKQFMWELKNKI